jgi:SAM-dependent methyltransferase
MNITDWENCYREKTTPWDRGGPSPPLRELFERRLPAGRVLVPGCGRGYEVALVAAHGGDVTGLDIAETAVREAAELHPHLASAFVHGDLFQLPEEFLGVFDFVVEHTCLSGMPPALRVAYRDAVRAALRPGGHLIGVWFVNPDLDPGEEGPPFPLPLEDLDALFAEDFEIVEDYIPRAAFEGREGRERVRVLRKK